MRAAGALAACLLSLGCAAPAPPAPSPSVRLAETRRLMGVPWTITVQAPSAAAGRAAIAAGFAEVARLEGILSDYEPESELSRLSAAAPTPRPVPVGPDLWRVLERAVAIRDATGGAFDPTVGPLVTAWRRARRTGRLPQPESLAAAREAVGAEQLRLVADGQLVELARPGMRLDLGGIGMGYAVDRAMEELKRLGIDAAMIDASGDIAVSAPPPGTSGWTIEIAPLPGHSVSAPRERLVLAHAAVTTSGDAFQAVEIEGRRYSHIVDPRTGLGVAGPAAVTVVAPDCTTADALATAASVLGPQDGADAVRSFPGCAARFFGVRDGALETSQTPGWPSQDAQDSLSDP